MQGKNSNIKDQLAIAVVYIVYFAICFLVLFSVGYLWGREDQWQERQREREKEEAAWSWKQRYYYAENEKCHTLCENRSAPSSVQPPFGSPGVWVVARGAWVVEDTMKLPEWTNADETYFKNCFGKEGMAYRSIRTVSFNTPVAGYQDDGVILECEKTKFGWRHFEYLANLGPGRFGKAELVAFPEEPNCFCWTYWDGSGDSVENRPEGLNCGWAHWLPLESSADLYRLDPYLVNSTPPPRVPRI